MRAGLDIKTKSDIVNREKIKEFLRKPPDTIDSGIVVCDYMGKSAIAIEFFNKRHEPYCFRIKPADYFEKDELIEIMKILYWDGGIIHNNWYDIFSKWLKEID